MARNPAFKVLHACVAAVLFCGLIGCQVEVDVSNQTQDNLRIRGHHFMQGETEYLCSVSPGSGRSFEISRSSGAIGTLYINCPKDIDIFETPEDTVVITEPELNRLEASAGALKVYITAPMSTMGENGDMPSEDLSRDAEDESAEDLTGES